MVYRFWNAAIALYLLQGAQMKCSEVEVEDKLEACNKHGLEAVGTHLRHFASLGKR